MATPISGGTAFDFGAAAQATAPQLESSPAPIATARPATNTQPVDTVKLSPGAQVRLLKTQGQTVAEIAVNTALSAEAVNSYLGITQAPIVAASGK